MQSPLQFLRGLIRDERPIRQIDLQYLLCLQGKNLQMLVDQNRQLLEQNFEFALATRRSNSTNTELLGRIDQSLTDLNYLFSDHAATVEFQLHAISAELEALVSIARRPGKTAVDEQLAEVFRMFDRLPVGTPRDRVENSKHIERNLRALLATPLGSASHIAWCSLGWILQYEFKDLPGACDAFYHSRRLSVGDPDFHPLALRYYANSLYHQGELASALEVIDEMEDSDLDKNSHAIVEKARYAARLNKAELAETLLDKAIKLNPLVADFMGIEPDFLNSQVPLESILKRHLAELAGKVEEQKEAILALNGTLGQVEQLLPGEPNVSYCLDMSGFSFVGTYSMRVRELARMGEAVQEARTTGSGGAKEGARQLGYRQLQLEYECKPKQVKSVVDIDGCIGCLLAPIVIILDLFAEWKERDRQAMAKARNMDAIAECSRKKSRLEKLASELDTV